MFKRALIILIPAVATLVAQQPAAAPAGRGGGGKGPGRPALFFREEWKQSEKGGEHVVDGDRDAGTGRQTETVLQQLVGKDHGFFQAALAERGVDEARNFFLLERLVEHSKRKTLGQNF